VRLAPLALGLWLALAGAAAAEQWVEVSASKDRRIYVDRDSVRREGALIRAMIRGDFARPVKDKTFSRPFSRIVLERVDDCAKGLAAAASAAYFDAKGELIESYDYEKAGLEFQSDAPGSMGVEVRDYVCGEAAPAPATTAAPAAPPDMSLSPTEGQWVVLIPGKDEVSYYRIDSIRALGEHTVSVITKHTYARDAEADGKRYRTVVGLLAIDCQARRYAPLDSALYSEEGARISAHPVADEDATFYAIEAESIVDRLQRIVCAAPPPASRPTADPAASDEPRLATGTGWMSAKGYVVTASHVIAQAKRIVLYQNGHAVGLAEVVIDDPANDVALLRPSLKGVTHVAIPLSGRPAALGSPVFTIGYPAPDVLGVSVKMTSGEVSAVTGLDVASSRADDVRLMQISIPIQSGNSGGPVINDAGQAVGIVISTLVRTSDDDIAQNVNYALKVSYVRGLLSELPDVGGYRLVKPAAGRTALVGALQDAVFMILAVLPKDAPSH
jgi:S1-C subfamily serine protease